MSVKAILLVVFLSIWLLVGGCAPARTDTTIEEIGAGAGQKIEAATDKAKDAVDDANDKIEEMNHSMPGMDH